MLRGYTPLSVFHCAVAGELLVLPRQRLDFAAFAAKGGKTHLIAVQYDSALHYTDSWRAADGLRYSRTFHEEWCCRWREPLIDCRSHWKTLELAAYQKASIVKHYGSSYHVEYRRVPHCVFHNPPYRFEGAEYPSPGEAARRLSVQFPRVGHVTTPFPKSLSLDWLMRQYKRRGSDAPRFRAGFVALSGHLPVRRFNSRVGLVLAKRRLSDDDLSPRFRRQLLERVRRERPGENAQKLADDFIAHLKKEPRLMPSNSIRNGVLSLAYLDFLLELGFKVERVHHLVLFSARTRRSERSHIFSGFVIGRLRQRERLNRRAAFLRRLPVVDDAARKELLRCKVFAGLIK